MREKWKQDIDYNPTPTEKTRNPKFSEVCSWVKKLQNSTKKEVIIKTFKKYKISPPPNQGIPYIY